MERATALRRTPRMVYPSFLCCPLTQDVFTDPVICADGVTFERRAIEEHFRQRRTQIFMTNPITNSVLMDTQLIPNLAMKRVIEHWLPCEPPPLAVDEKKEYNTIVMQVPTLIISVLYNKQKQLHDDYQVDIEIEPDEAAKFIGTRQVTLRPLDPQTTSLPVQAEFRIWSMIQKHCFAESMRFDEYSGLPFTQLLFAISSRSYKIGGLLQAHKKLAIQKRLGIHFLVEKRHHGSSTEQDDRNVILTAWNSNHDNVQDALVVARDYILKKIE